MRVRLVLVVIVLAVSGSVAFGQSAPPATADRSIEDLNFLGGALSSPPFSDTVFGTDADFRQWMFERGTAVRVNVVPRFRANLPDGPASASERELPEPECRLPAGSGHHPARQGRR